MAQIIQFPSGTATLGPAAAPVAKRRMPKPKTAAPSKVSPIRPRVRVPKANRPEDEHAAMLARLARLWTQKAYELAQTEPNSEHHRMALHMAGISEKLPRNNLRVYTTATDIVEGIWKAWRRATIASLEWTLAEHRRIAALHDGDPDAKNRSKTAATNAEANAWREYERLVRVPASSLADFKHFKLDRRFESGMGSLDWMRKFKPDLAAMLDEEQAALIAKSEARKAARAAKKRGA